MKTSRLFLISMWIMLFLGGVSCGQRELQATPALQPTPALPATPASLISDIWYSLVAMMAAGAACGATIGWSYGRLFEPSIRTWLGYNASYVIALAVLGLVSVAAFEPKITMAELLTTDGPPSDLIGAAFPMTILFTLGAAVILSVLFGRTLAAFGAIFVTCSV